MNHGEQARRCVSAGINGDLVIDADVLTPELPKIAPRWQRTRLVIVGVLASLGLIALITRVFRSSLNDRRDDCEHRMEQLAAATLHYAVEHGGVYPTDLRICMELGRLSSRNLVCPNSSLESNPPRADEISGALNAREETSYRYVGSGVADTHSHYIAIWMESKVNHAEHGINVAFADGSVEWVAGENADRILKQFAAGTRPVVSSSDSATRP